MPKRISDRKSGGNNAMPTIQCCCGAHILLVPNVKQMSEAIEAHVEVHKKKIKDPQAAEAEAERVRDDLIAKVLIKATEA